MAMITQITLQHATIVLCMENTRANNSALYEYIGYANVSIFIQTDNYIELRYYHAGGPYTDIDAARNEVDEFIDMLEKYVPCKRLENELDYIVEKHAAGLDQLMLEVGTELASMARRFECAMHELALVEWKAANKPRYEVGSLVTAKDGVTGVVNAVFDPSLEAPTVYRYDVRFDNGRYFRLINESELKRATEKLEAELA